MDLGMSITPRTKIMNRKIIILVIMSEISFSKIKIKRRIFTLKHEAKGEFTQYVQKLIDVLIYFL